MSADDLAAAIETLASVDEASLNAAYETVERRRARRADRLAPRVNHELAARTSLLARALADPTRAAIVDLMTRVSHPIGQSVIVEAVGLSQPSVSRHMDRLIAADIVVTSTKVRRPYYSLNYNALGELAAFCRTEAPR